MEQREWWKGNMAGERARLARAMELNDYDATLHQIVDQMYLGDAALKLMQGVGSRKDIGHVMGEVIMRCENELRENTIALLALTDSRSDEAQQLHFECRVCAGIISHINQLVREANDAADQYTNQGDTV